MAKASTPSDCLGILLVGRTGFGKSTTGNMLLRAGGESVLRDYQIKNFEEGEETDSCTKEIRAVFRPGTEKANAVLVVDTPGFADTDALAQHKNVFQSNLAMFRDLIRKRVREKLRIHRVLYFLPFRGPPQRADGIIQEEIKVLHYYFGNAIFDRMVLVATQQKRFSAAGITKKDREDIIKAFTRGLKLALGNDHPECPPLVYIGFDDIGGDVQRRIESAPVVSNEVLVLDKFVQGTCSKCSSKYILSKKDNPRDTTKRINVGPHEERKCHPLFVPTISFWVRVAGGVGHIATLGIPMLIWKLATGRIPWPTFTSKEEICVNCKMSPGSDGCLEVGTEHEATLPDKEKKTMTIKHDNQYEDLFSYVDVV